MERLAEKNINTASEYDRIYFERKEKGVDEFDLTRWKLLLKYYKKGKLIDLGCLDSLVPILAKETDKNSEVWAVDIAEESLKDMEKRYPLSGVFWHKADVYHTDFPDHYFDYAVAGELIEHLENPQRFIKEAMRILKHRGVLALSTPLKERIGEVDAERHLWSFSIQDIKDMLESYGKVKIRTFPYIHIPYTKYHHKNIIAWCVKK